MKTTITKQGRVFTLELSEDEFFAIVNLLGKTNHSKRIALGLPERQAKILSEIYYELPDNITDEVRLKY